MRELTQSGYMCSCHSHLNKRGGRLLWYSTGTGHCLAHHYISIHNGNDDIYGHIQQTLVRLRKTDEVLADQGAAIIVHARGTKISVSAVLAYIRVVENAFRILAQRW